MPQTDSNPLYRSQYLLGPIETIVCSRRALASGHLSLHDLSEAYRTLSMRIRDSSDHLSTVSDVFPALESLRDKGADVVAALRRDISRALRISAWQSSVDSSAPTAETVRCEVMTHNENRARDISILCHYALRLLSEIFRLPALSSLFACTSRISSIDELFSRCHQRTTLAYSWEMLFPSFAVLSFHPSVYQRPPFSRLG